MARNIKHETASPEVNPGVNIVFRGKYKQVYFDLRKIGIEEFDYMTSTELARLVIADFVRNYNRMDTKRRAMLRSCVQLPLNLIAEKKSLKVAKK